MNNFCTLHLKRNQCNNRENKEQKKIFFLEIYNINISYTTLYNYIILIYVCILYSNSTSHFVNNQYPYSHFPQ